MRILQIATNLVPGDAISNHVFELDKIFKAAGLDSWICGVDVDKRLHEKYSIISFEELPKPDPQDIVVYHLCQKHYINEIIDKMICKKILIYHNMTPGYYYSEYLPEFSKHLDKSTDAMKAMNSCFDWCIADSEFNKQQLIEFGYNEEIISVIPIPLEFSDFNQPPDEKTVEKYSNGYTNILFVGRIAPNKKFEDIIRIFAYYKKHMNKKSRLILVGGSSSKKYLYKLKEYVKILETDDIEFTGKIPFGEILAYYSVADIFLCMSEHEGFCVPLVEAMLFDIPIIAYESTAIPYTLSGSGVLVDDKDPALISKIIDIIVTDETVRHEIIKGQQERLEFFNSEKVSCQVLKIIDKVTV